jgi:hypothetical protein
MLSQLMCVTLCSVSWCAWHHAQSADVCDIMLKQLMCVTSCSVIWCVWHHAQSADVCDIMLSKFMCDIMISQLMCVTLCSVSLCATSCSVSWCVWRHTKSDVTSWFPPVSLDDEPGGDSHDVAARGPPPSHIAGSAEHSNMDQGNIIGISPQDPYFNIFGFLITPHLAHWMYISFSAR